MSAFSFQGRTASAGNITPPPLPPGLAPVPAGQKLFLAGHAVGTQNYVCRPSGAGVAYVLFTPEATLFSDDGGQVITHYFSPNPDEPNTVPTVVSDGMIRATWQHRDTSTVWAKLLQPNGAVTVDPTAIPWLQKATFEAAVQFAQTEGIVPEPESAHAIRAAIDEALDAKAKGEKRVILFNLSGHGNFDMAAYESYLGGKLEDYEHPAEAIKEALKKLPHVNLPS